jgi:dTDP-glucose pyrophosphorylase
MNNWQKIVVSPDMSILEAMKIIDGAGTQFVMVLDATKKLLGVVTDGDVRRGILNNISLAAPVSEIMNTQPRCLFNNVPKIEAIKFLEEKHITHAPLVDKDRRVTGVISTDDRVALATFPNTVVLMVGGLGTRLGELTSNCPKPMLHIQGKPVLEIILQDLIDNGFKDFVFCVNYRAEVIQDHFSDGKKFGVSIRYVHEDKRMGTAGALGLLPKDISGPLLVMNGDIVTKVNFRRLLEFHSEHPVKATMAVRKYEFQIPFGVVSTADGLIQEIEEKPVHEFLVSAGIYVIEESALTLIPKDEFFDMPLFFNQLIAKKEKTQAFPIHEYWLDIGRQDDLERAESEYAELLKIK